MTDTERILLTRGIELCSEWDKHNDAMNEAEQQWDRHHHDERRLEAGIRLDEICLLARSLEIASYDDFRELIQKNYESTKEEDV
ncbi:MAG: hypothetical protein ACK5MN_10500 [Lachnospiraceae bacterium]